MRTNLSSRETNFPFQLLNVFASFINMLHSKSEKFRGRKQTLLYNLIVLILDITKVALKVTRAKQGVVNV
jgi:hypothetical protein